MTLADAWPARKSERLRFLVEAGMHSFKEIGEIMGITKNAAIGKARRLNLDGPRMKGPKDVRVPTTLIFRLNALHLAFDAARVPDPPRIKPDKGTDNPTRRINGRMRA
jgi:hypothetical protein